jgi:uncharacterized protein YcbX
MSETSSPAWPPTDSDVETVRVAATYIYPVKACGAMPVAALHIDRWGGAQDDRRWALVNAQGEVTWQGAYPRLVLISPQLTEHELLLEAPGVPALRVQGDGLAPCSFQIWNEPLARQDRFEGHDAGDAASAWVSAVAGAPLRLVRMGDEAVGRDHANRLHLVSRASCDEARAAAGREDGTAVEVLRYRPNIVIEGPDAQLQPFAEDYLRAMHWHDEGRAATLAVNARCVRCVVPNVDPGTGSTDERVLVALAALSAERLPGEPVCFGSYGKASPGARLAQGQAVVLEFSF